MVKNNVWRNNQCAFFIIMNQITDKMDVRGVASLTDEELEKLKTSYQILDESYNSIN